MRRSRCESQVLGCCWASLLTVLLAGPVQAQAPAGEPAASTAAVAASRSASAKRPGRARPAGEQAYVYRDTSQGDNLWYIAGAVVGANPGIDRNQAMVAIFRANPAAFPEGNLHRIQKGLDLTIPSLAQIRAESRTAAAALVAQHRKAYADRRLVPVPLKALEGEAVASASTQAAVKPDTPGSAASATGGMEPPAPVGAAASWWWGAVVSVAGVLVLALLRAWWRRPMTLDLGFEHGAEPALADTERSAQALADQHHADEVVAKLYSETLEQPLEMDLPGDETPDAPLDEEGVDGAPQSPAADIPETEPPAEEAASAQALAPLPKTCQPTLPSAHEQAAAVLAGALGQAYRELDRTQTAKLWQERGGNAAES